MEYHTHAQANAQSYLGLPVRGFCMQRAHAGPFRQRLLRMERINLLRSRLRAIGAAQWLRETQQPPHRHLLHSFRSSAAEAEAANEREKTSLHEHKHGTMQSNVVPQPRRCFGGQYDCQAGSSTERCKCSRGRAKLLGQTSTDAEGTTTYAYTCCENDPDTVGEECGDCCVPDVVGIIVGVVMGVCCLCCVVAGIVAACYFCRSQQVRPSAPGAQPQVVAVHTGYAQPTPGYPQAAQPVQAAAFAPQPPPPAPVPAGLPPGWNAAQDPQGRTYYYNGTTTQWEPPKGVY